MFSERVEAVRVHSLVHGKFIYYNLICNHSCVFFETKQENHDVPKGIMFSFYPCFLQ